MASEDEIPPEGAGEGVAGDSGGESEAGSGGAAPGPDAPRSDAHVSFVQRLGRHFGPEVDPRINLQDEDDDASRSGEPGSATPTSVEDFVKRLSPSIEVGGRYEIKQDVASGGMGTILRVWDGDLRRNLAMKVMHGPGGAKSPLDPSTEHPGRKEVDPERLGRFLEEAQITGQLDHPGVVPVHDLGIDSKGRCYFTMRFVRGRELKEVLDLAREARDGWTRTKVLGVILKVCEAMAYAHSKGVVHRDLKPANIMVGRFGETYVMDWGLARVLGRRDSHDLRLRPRPEDASAMSLVRTVRYDESASNPDSPLVTMDGDVIGTPSYMAPEQARGKLDEVGPRSDVYSLGAILYYMHTGQAPYVKPGERVSPHTVLGRVLDAPPTPVEKLAPHEPAELVAICTKAMARDPAQRYGSMLEVADDIQAFLENRVVRAYEKGSLAEFKKWVLRNKGMAAGIAGMLTLVFAGALFFGWQQNLEKERLEDKEQETTLAKEDAERNLARAQESERKAKANLELALEQRAMAEEQEELARQNEDRALRSGYAANILAADYSFKLNELAEARARLRDAEADMRGWEWQHLNMKVRAPLAELGSYNAVEALAFQPLANRALILSGQGRLGIEDLDTLQEVGPDTITIAGDEFLRTVLHLFTNLSMAVSPDGERVAIVGEDPGVQVFDLESGERPPGVDREGLPGHAVNTSAAAFSPSGRYLATGDDDGQILVRDALNWRILRRPPGHIAQVTGLAWSPGSDRLASSSRDGTVALWDFTTGETLGALRGHSGAVRAVAWDLEGRQVFTCGEDGAVNVWDVDSESILRTLREHSGPVHSMAYDPNRGRLVTGSGDRTVRIWDVDTGDSVVLRGHEAAVLEVAFEPDGQRVLSSDAEGTVYLWDAAGDLSTTELFLHRDAVRALAFDPTGKRLVSASEDRELVLWDAETCQPLRRMRGHGEAVYTAVFSSDGRWILSGSQDKTALLWDAETGKHERTFGAFDRWVGGALMTPDGSRVLVATGDKKVHVVDAEDRSVLRVISDLKYSVDAMALSADGTRLVTVGRDLLIWDLEGDLTQPLISKKGRHRVVAISPDGEGLATGNSTGLLQLWNARTGEWVADHQDQDRLHALLYSPDGRRLVSASDDGEIHVRDAKTGDTLLVLTEPRGAVRALAFDPAGARLATGVADGTVRIYETGEASERYRLRHTASELRERARDMVDQLFSERFRMEEVLEVLEADTSMTHALREAALRLVHLRGDDPLPLMRTSIEECLDAERDSKVYDLALERAAEAGRFLKELPSSPLGAGDGRSEQALLDLAMGVTYFRVGRYSDAQSHLNVTPPERDARGLYGPRERALRLLFLCMSQAQAQDPQGAERSWRLARQSVLNDVELSQNSEMLGLLAEVETTIRASASPSGS